MKTLTRTTARKAQHLTGESVQSSRVNHRIKPAVREIQLFDRRGRHISTVGLPPIGPEAEIVKYGDLLYVRISHLKYREATVWIARDFR